MFNSEWRTGSALYLYTAINISLERSPLVDRNCVHEQGRQVFPNESIAESTKFTSIPKTAHFFLSRQLLLLYISLHMLGYNIGGVDFNCSP